MRIDKLLLLILTAVLLIIPHAAAIKSKGYYSEDASLFYLKSTWNITDGTTIPAATTGQVWTEFGGDSTISDEALIMDVDGDAVCVPMGNTQNFTIWSNFMSLSVGAMSTLIDTYGEGDTTCAGTRATRFQIDAGGVVEAVNSTGTEVGVTPAASASALINYTVAQVCDITAMACNYTFFTVTNNSGIYTLTPNGSIPFMGVQNSKTAFGSASLRVPSNLELRNYEIIILNWSSPDEALVIPPKAGPADSCTAPGSGDWAIACSDNCAFDTAQDVPGNIHVSGSGNIMISAPLTFTGSNQIMAVDSGCTIDIRQGGEIG